MDAIARFVERLAGEAGSPQLGNPYAGRGGEDRRANLCLYLSRMAAIHPSVLLVGEAPGYRGCARTGVPFTSESLLLSEPSPFGLFGTSAGFRACPSAAPRDEATASAVWVTLARLKRPPLLWNALPLHPHQADRPLSNRTPTPSEVARGEPFLRDMMALFDIERLVAVGNQSAVALQAWGIRADRVRHPSHGGRRLFAAQLEALLGSGSDLDAL